MARILPWSRDFLSRGARRLFFIRVFNLWSTDSYPNRGNSVCIDCANTFRVCSTGLGPWVLVMNSHAARINWSVSTLLNSTFFFSPLTTICLKWFSIRFFRSSCEIECISIYINIWTNLVRNFSCSKKSYFGHRKIISILNFAAKCNFQMKSFTLYLHFDHPRQQVDWNYYILIVAYSQF